jgi:hypothetical protein
MRVQHISEISSKPWNIWGKRRRILKIRFSTEALPLAYASVVTHNIRPLCKCPFIIFDQHKPDPKMKLCICNAILNIVSQTDWIEHTINSTQSVQDPQSLLFIATYMLQFHNTANITNHTPVWFPTITVRNQTQQNLNSLTVDVGEGDIVIIAAMQVKRLTK